MYLWWRALEWIETGLARIKLFLIALRISVRLVAVLISFVSVGSHHTRLLPQLSTEAASLCGLSRKKDGGEQKGYEYKQITNSARLWATAA